jgi:hypothetical protein
MSFRKNDVGDDDGLLDAVGDNEDRSVRCVASSWTPLLLHGQSGAHLPEGRSLQWE